MQWLAQAPANIALIKYMGKTNPQENLPINSSLSYTLHNLLSSVQLETHPGKQDFWEPLNTPGVTAHVFSPLAQKRFLLHLALVKNYFHYSGAFIVRSSNNFPHSSGLASSASSFAALTKCAMHAMSELTQTPLPCIETQAQLSRQGSGSSCRSFFSPWALWENNSVKAIELPYNNLLHQVIVVSQEEKKVSSSEAHARIRNSTLFSNRGQRAEENLKNLLHALTTNHWAEAYQICWQEFQDMHALFATATPSFSYITAAGKEVLAQLQNSWQQQGDGPLITMDAGPNIHLLYRADQTEMAHRFKVDHLLGNYDVL